MLQGTMNTSDQVSTPGIASTQSISLRLLSPRCLFQDLGLGKETVRKAVLEGLFTPPIKIFGRRRAGYPEHEVRAVIQARIRGDSDDQIRVLVAELVAARGGR